MILGFNTRLKMEIKLIGLYFILFYSLTYTTLHAKGTPTTLPDSSHTTNQVLIFPIAYYIPDTNWMFGLGGVDYFKISSKKDSMPAHLSLISFSGSYSITDAIQLWSNWNLFLKNNSYFFKGEISYKKMPDKFYGIGNYTLRENEERYQYQVINAKGYFYRHIQKKLFLGLTYQFQYSYNFILDPTKQLSRGEIAGTKGGINSGMGIAILHDTRTSSIHPHAGHYIEFTSFINKHFLGSDYVFNNFTWLVKQYIEVIKNHIIALHGLININDNTPPVLNMSFLGSDEILRGYAKNRYRDANLMACQVEYRSPSWKRLGFTLFTGVGEVFSLWKNISYQGLRPSYGAGLRLCINKKERLNIRLDYAFGYQTQNFYLAIGEAF